MLSKAKKRSVPFLAGGLYRGCKGGVDYARDRLFLKDKDNNKRSNKVKDFGEFALTTNNVFISPQAMANYLFKFKGSCSVKENETIRELKRNITAWKDANGNNKYIVIKHQSGNDVGVGMGRGGR